MPSILLTKYLYLELIYKEVIEYECPDRHSRARGSAATVQNHATGIICC